ncbi:MAG: cyclic nucleotide-binding domain-containing protein [Acidimicrobiales bacterium]
MRDQKLERLTSTALFAGLDRHGLEAVAETTTEMQFPAGTVLAREGSQGHEAFVVVSGSITVSISGDQVGTIGAGEVAGELALLLREPRQATLTAATDVDLLVIEPGRFHTLLEQPSIARALVTALARRLSNADKALRH